MDAATFFDALSPAAAPLLSGALVIFVIQRWFKKIDANQKALGDRMSAYETAQNACKLDNAKSFVTRDEAAKIWERLDQHHVSIGILKGKAGLPE